MLEVVDPVLISDRGGGDAPGRPAEVVAAAGRGSGVEQVGLDVVAGGIVQRLVVAVAAAGGAGCGAAAIRVADKGGEAAGGAVAVERRDVGRGAGRVGEREVGEPDAGGGIAAALRIALGHGGAPAVARLVAGEAGGAAGVAGYDPDAGRRGIGGVGRVEVGRGIGGVEVGRGVVEDVGVIRGVGQRRVVGRIGPARIAASAAICRVGRRIAESGVAAAASIGGVGAAIVRSRIGRHILGAGVGQRRVAGAAAVAGRVGGAVGQEGDRAIRIGIGCAGAEREQGKQDGG